jgi:RNA methyltransferase, TrmH family
MPSRAEIKYYSSLKLKKFRQKYGLFTVEGEKSVRELLEAGIDPEIIFSTEEHAFPGSAIVSESEMRQLSSLDHPPGILAVAQMPDYGPFTPPENGIVLVLDGIRDPGNLGTILRSALWFGFETVWLSSDCAEVTNPKCIQATMGAFTRVRWHSGELEPALRTAALPVFGCLLEGQPLGATSVRSPAFLLVGSESHGIRENLIPLVTHPVTIPRYGAGESLNAGVAAAIAMYHFASVGH